MQTKLELFQELEDTLIANLALISVLKGFCETKAAVSEDIGNVLIVLEYILNKQTESANLLDQINMMSW